MVSEKIPATPDAVTVAISRRVAQLRGHEPGRRRGRARISGADLAGRMNEMGIPWTRTTVAKLESGRRASLTVQELLALARALDVPPVWLLVDPTSTDPVPAENGTASDPWAELLWMSGLQMPHDRVPYTVTRVWESAEKSIKMVNEIMDFYERMARIAGERDMREIIEFPGWSEDENVRKELTYLENIAKRFRWLLKNGLVVPPVPEHLAERAQALNVQLPTTVTDDGPED